MILSRILFPWKRHLKWAVDLQERQIRLTLSESNRNRFRLLYTSTTAIDSLKGHNWQEFFMNLRRIDQGKALEMMVCLPEEGLLIKPLPDYPNLNKKELRHALGIFQEQVLPWSSKNSLRAIQLLPKTDLQRSQENRSYGYLYALELTPYQGFFQHASASRYALADIALRSQLYLQSLEKALTGEGLFLMEFFKNKVRCHLFQQGILTHYRDFAMEKTYCEYEIPETLAGAITTYIRYFYPCIDQMENILILGCISEDSLFCTTFSEILFTELKQEFPTVRFISLLTFQETTQMICPSVLPKRGLKA